MGTFIPRPKILSDWLVCSIGCATEILRPLARELILLSCALGATVLSHISRTERPVPITTKSGRLGTLSNQTIPKVWVWWMPDEEGEDEGVPEHCHQPTPFGSGDCFLFSCSLQLSSHFHFFLFKADGSWLTMYCCFYYPLLSVTEQMPTFKSSRLFMIPDRRNNGIKHSLVSFYQCPWWNSIW